jgi:putative peptide zinc metalloprotease protein
MTDSATRPIPVAAGPRINGGPVADGEVLTRATGVELLGEVPGSGLSTAAVPGPSR